MRMQEHVEWASGEGALFTKQDLSTNGIYEKGRAAGTDPVRRTIGSAKRGAASSAADVGEVVDTVKHLANQGE